MAILHSFTHYTGIRRTDRRIVGRICHNNIVLCVYCITIKKVKLKKSAQRRHKHCALAVVRRSLKISPRRRPLLGDAGWPKFNQLEMVTTFTNKPSLAKIDAYNFELVGGVA